MPIEVLVMAKAPVPGQVKTRLQGLLEPHNLAALQAAFIEDSLASCLTTANLLASKMGDKAVASRMRVRLACAPGPQDEYFQRVSRRTGVELLDQGPGDLGERMERLQGQMFQVGALGVIFLGVDTPAMPAETLQAAAEALRRSSVVLGPAEDGGYYLLGSIVPTATLFSDMPWGTSHVLALTRERLAADSTIWTELATFWDVDHPKDLVRLAGLLEANPARAPRTARLLAELEVTGKA